MSKAKLSVGVLPKKTKALSQDRVKESESRRECPELKVERIIGIEDVHLKTKKVNELVNYLVTNYKNSASIFEEISEHLIDINCDDSIRKLITRIQIFNLNDSILVDNFLKLIFEFLNLKPFNCNDVLLKTLVPAFSGSQSAEDSAITATELDTFNKIHQLLSQLNRIDVKIGFQILKAVEKLFPFHGNSSIHTYNCYIYNLLRTLDYLDKRQSVVFVLFDKLLWIDSISPREKLQLNDQEVFAIDDCETSKNKSLSDLLDHSINQVLNYIDSKTTKISGELDEEEANKLVLLFETAFCKLILPSKFCMHLQFLLFYLCSKSENLCREFIKILWEKTADDQSDLEIRQKSIFYVGSLLTKGNFVTIEMIVSFFAFATRFIHEYICNYVHDKSDLNADDIVICSICQVMFSVFCSRHLEFDTMSIKSLKNMNFQKIISSSLNPLSYCFPKISHKFMELSKHYQICYCSTTIENTRKTNTPVNHIKNFVGFESFGLPLSYLKIEPICREYSTQETDYDIAIDYNGHSSDMDTDYVMNSYKSSYSNQQIWEKLLSDSSPGISDPQSWAMSD